VELVEEHMEQLRRLTGGGGPAGGGAGDGGGAGALMGRVRGALTGYGWAELLRVVKVRDRLGWGDRVLLLPALRDSSSCASSRCAASRDRVACLVIG
jgi:hypothetical protein